MSVQDSYVRSLKSLTALSLSACLLGTLLPASAQSPTSLPKPTHGYVSQTKRDRLLSQVTFKTPQGDILLTLPADLHSGDTFSGAIHLKASGKDARQQAVNAQTLAEYRLLLGTQTVSVSDPTGRWTMPAPSEAILRLEKSDSSTELARAALAVAVSSVQTPASNLLPQKGQAGRPLALSGQAGADWSSLHVLIGGREAAFLAASPRIYLVQTPSDVFGKTTLQVKKGDATVAEGSFRNDRVRHSVNPWPYIIVGLIGFGIALAITINDVLRHAGDGLFQNIGGLQ